ncbi:MAG: hypothetical protein FWD77_08400 [Betaproteobacteria bacterium]|nr:hypothetical protein [Betaproteobacteria bacterium]
MHSNEIAKIDDIIKDKANPRTPRASDSEPQVRKAGLLPSFCLLLLAGFLLFFAALSSKAAAADHWRKLITSDGLLPEIFSPNRTPKKAQNRSFRAQNRHFFSTLTKTLNPASNQAFRTFFGFAPRAKMITSPHIHI